MRNIRPANWRTERDVVSGLSHLKLALHYLKAADCPRTVERVRRAIKSAGGAQRHVAHRLNRTDPMIYIGDGQYSRRSACSPTQLERARAQNSAVNEGKL